MNLETGKIPGYQLIFLIMGFVSSLSMLFLPTQPAKNLAWLAILVSIIEGLLFASIYTTLALRFPGKTLVEINEFILGPLVGKIVSLGFLWYFLHLASLHLRNYGDFFTIVYPETPLIVFLIATIFVCALAVKNGIEVIARCSILLVSLIIFLYFFDLFILLKEMDLSKLLPLRNVSVQDFFKASNAVNSVSFGETIIFMMIFPFLNKYVESRKSLLAIIIAGLLIAISAARNTAVMGDLLSIFQYPTYETLKIVDVGDFLTRMEIVVSINFISMGFLKISILYYGLVLGTAQLLKLRTYHPLVFPFGVIITVLGVINYGAISELIPFALEIYPLYSFPFEIGIPLFLLVTAVVRGLPKKTKGDQI